MQETIGGAPVFILAAEFGAGKIKGKATDNASLPIELATATAARTVCWSLSTFSEWDASKIERSIFVYNSGNLLPIRGDYRIVVEPKVLSEGIGYISLPIAEDKPANQGEVR